MFVGIADTCHRAETDHWQSGDDLWQPPNHEPWSPAPAAMPGRPTAAPSATVAGAFHADDGPSDTDTDTSSSVGELDYDAPDLQNMSTAQIDGHLVWQ